MANDLQGILVAPASQDAHVRRPTIQRPKNTAFGPWRSKNGSPVEVDAIGLQALERGVHLALDGLWPQVADRSPAAADLRGQDDLVAVAPVRHPAPDDRLRAAVLDQVGVRGVDEVPAGGCVGVEDNAGLWLVGGPAEHVAAEAEREDVQVGASEQGHAVNFARRGTRLSSAWRGLFSPTARGR
jgi:hypothetical protein